MKSYYLTYGLNDGYIHDWLALGPEISAVTAQPEPGETELAFRTRLLAQADHVTNDFPKPPMEIDKVVRGTQDLYWETEHCQADHLIERGLASKTFTHQKQWIFTRFACTGQKKATIQITTTCPTSVWLNGRHVKYCEHVTALDDQVAQTYSVAVNLKPGNNDLLVRMEQIVVDEAVAAVAVRLADVPLAEVKVRVPTITEQPERRQDWERSFEYAYADRAVYGRDDPVQIICRDDMPSWYQGAARLQTPDGAIYAEMYVKYRSNEKLEGLLGMQLTAGRMQVSMMPEPETYYNRKFRARRVFPFYVSMGRYETEPVGTYDERLILSMKEADRSADGLYSQLAKMALGWWNIIEEKAIRDAIGRVKRYEADSLSDLLGLVAMSMRMGHYKEFPKDLLPEIDECIVSYNYALDKLTPIDMTADYNQIILYAAQVLAGQANSKETFAASGLTGRQERTRGEKLATDWLHTHAQRGFALWNTRIDLTVSALALLADLAKTDALAEMAVVMLDKLLFGLAVNSFQGTYAAPRADAQASWVRSGRLAPESPLNYLLWGVGTYNQFVKGLVSLGLAGKSYELPEMLRTIALDRWPGMLSKERQEMAQGDEANTVVYKTPDYMLSSVQDYRAGQRGKREHIWQATLSPDAVVFANHPTSFSDSDSRQAGWWCGNGSLPRVAQWKDALVALYNLPDDDWLGFTHAFFPGYAFDEHVLEGGWAFGRKGSGYIALHAPGMALVDMGFDAMRELRVKGPKTAWLCQMGQAEVDGSFADFRAAVLAKSLTIDGLHVEWETVRGERLSFGWNEPLRVNGKEEAITGFKHVENPYAVAEFPAQTMDIGYGQDIMRLHLA